MRISSVRKWVHISLTALGSAYLTFVFLSKKIVELIFSHIEMEKNAPVAVYLLFAACFFALCYQLLNMLVQNVHTLFTHNSCKDKLSSKLFWMISLVVFVLNIAYLIACYPGGYSPDNHNQWTQAHTMVFNDHHPFFHTYLYVLLTSICDSYTFMQVVQIAAFSLAVGYLAATLYAWGFRLPVVCALCGVITLNTQTRIILLYFWKDTTMSILFLFLLSQMVNIFLSRGIWLKKWSHWLSHGVLLAGITLVRHNAILLTAPLLVLMFFFLPSVRKACLKLLMIVLVLILGVKGPLQSLYHVAPASDQYLELVGLPMNILCAVYTESPETLPENARAFMEGFTSRAELCTQYTLGNFNYAKWTLGFTQEQLAKTPIADFLSLTLETIQKNTILSALSVLELTDMVWEPMGLHYGYDEPGVYNVLETIPIPKRLQSGFCNLFEMVDGVLSGPFFQKPTAQLGVLMLVMLIALYLSIHNFRGWSGLWLILPIVCYNFGTMLLLCGPDYRFFHFNCLAAWPLVLLLLSKPRSNQNETCKSI